MLFARLNKVCESNLSPAQYVDRVYSMLPVYSISSCYATVWQIAFDKIVSVAKSSTADARTLFKCAMIERLAMASVEWRLNLSGFNLFYECRRNEFDGMLNFINRDADEWREFDAIIEFLGMRRLPDESVLRGLHLKTGDVRIAWMSAFMEVVRSDDPNNGGSDVMEYDDAVHQVIMNSDLVGLDQLEKCSILSQFTYDFDLSRKDGLEAWQKDVKTLEQFLGRWSECPVIAEDHFVSLCRDYSIAAKTASHLLNGRELWSLVQVVKEWRIGMADSGFSRVLAEFAKLLADVSARTDVEFRHIWREYSAVAIEFWKNRLGALDDRSMRDHYFYMIKAVSDLERVSAEERVSFVRQLRQTVVFLADEWKSAEHARLLKDCNKEVFSAATKYLFAAEVLTGIPLAKNVSGDAEILLAAEDILAQARAEGRSIDEDLVREFRRMNGLEET